MPPMPDYAAACRLMLPTTMTERIYAMRCLRVADAADVIADDAYAAVTFFATTFVYDATP